MNTNKVILWITAIFLSGAVCAVSAVAGVEHPEAYKKLTAVELAPENVPMMKGGLANLSGDERQHREQLPLQLSGAVKKVKKSHYSPSSRKSRSKSIRF